MATSPQKTLLALLALAFAIGALAGSAQAATFGQIGEPFGNKGVEPGQFHRPGLFGVDPVDGSVYAGDITADENNYRIQKFSAAGKLEATALVPRKIESGGQLRAVAIHGIAVDHARKRLYLVQAC